MIENDPLPPLELFRKFIRFGTATLSLVLFREGVSISYGSNWGSLSQTYSKKRCRTMLLRYTWYTCKNIYKNLYKNLYKVPLQSFNYHVKASFSLIRFIILRWHIIWSGALRWICTCWNSSVNFLWCQLSSTSIVMKRLLWYLIFVLFFCKWRAIRS